MNFWEHLFTNNQQAYAKTLKWILYSGYFPRPSNKSIRIFLSGSASSVLSYVEEPSVFLPEKDVLIQTGEDFSIVCQVGGVPTPEVTWLFANHTPIKTVHMGEKVGSWFVSKRHSLLLNLPNPYLDNLHGWFQGIWNKWWRSREGKPQVQY